MRKYPKYKASGIDWLGEIPSEWNATLLKRSLKDIKDGTHGSFNRPSEGMPLLSAKNVQSDKIDLSESESLISESDYKSIVKNGYPKKNDLLLTIVGTIGRAYVYDLDYPLAFQRSVAFLRFKKGSIIKFYYYQVQSSLFLDQLFSLAKTSAQSGVYLSDIKSSIALVPPLPEQDVIVRFLDYKTGQMDRFIANRQKQIELLKEQKAGIINKAVTKGINPNAKMKDSGIEWIWEVPEHWSVTKLKFVSKIFGRIGFRGYTINDLVEKGEGAITISPSNMKANEMNFESCTYISWFKYQESPEIKIFNGDVLFVKTGSTYGKVSMVENLMEPATINPQILVFKKIKTNPMFFYHQLRSKLIQAHVKTSVIGGTIPTISQEKIGNYYFLLPSKSEQEQIIEHITNETKIIDELISKYQKQIDLMQEYRTSLISQAVTGKIDVREWEPKKKQIDN